jgi:hypothetical protein
VGLTRYKLLSTASPLVRIFFEKKKETSLFVEKNLTRGGARKSPKMGRRAAIFLQNATG